MGENLNRIKGFIGLTIAAPLAGAAATAVGGAAAIPRGIGSATQSLIGVGLLSQGAKLIKWK